MVADALASCISWSATTMLLAMHMGPCLPGGRISATFNISVLRNNTNANIAVFAEIHSMCGVSACVLLNIFQHTSKYIYIFCHLR